MTNESNLSRRSALKNAGVVGMSALFAQVDPLATSVMASTSPLRIAEDEFNAYPEHIIKYLKRLYDPSTQRLAFREDYPGGLTNWKHEARSALRRKLGLDVIAASVGNHQPVVELGETTDFDEYTRQRGVIEMEPEVRIPFWLLKPKGKASCPLGVFPHGHDFRGHDTSAGVYVDDAHRKKSLAQDRDVAVQAVKRGFVAIAPAVRGLAAWTVPDLRNRHGGQQCRSHVMHCLLAGRTAIGERVWDMQRIVDWASRLPEVNPHHVLMMGNSGGGVLTIFAAACDERITIAVPSCSFITTFNASGYIIHCDCDMVPGLLELGGLPHVAGLITPRCLLSVNGRKDTLPQDEIENAVALVRRIYQVAGHPQRYEHRWGGEGHRFYKDLMWPFVEAALRDKMDG